MTEQSRSAMLYLHTKGTHHMNAVSNKMGYTHEHMAVSKGIVRQTELPLALIDHPTHGRLSITAEGTYFWVRFQRNPTDALHGEFTLRGWWFSDRDGKGRKGYWTDTTRNGDAADMLADLGYDAPDITHNERIKAAPKAKAVKQASKPALVPATQAAKTATPVSPVTSDAPVWNGYRWMDSKGRFVKSPAGKGQTAAAAKPAPVVIQMSGAPSVGEQVIHTNGDAKLELLRAALAQQAELIRAIQAL